MALDHGQLAQIMAEAMAGKETPQGQKAGTPAPQGNQDLTKAGDEGEQILESFRKQGEGEEEGRHPLEVETMEAEQRLQREWGPAYEERISAARANLVRIDTTGRLKEVLEWTRLGDDPDVIADFLNEKKEGDPTPQEVEAYVGELKKELDNLGLGILAQPGGPTVAQARTVVELLNEHPEHPYWQSKRGDALNRMVQVLYAVAYGEEE